MISSERDTLISELITVGSKGRADFESDQIFRHRFYPVPEHIRALDPDVVLVLGPRGSGKSQLFRAVTEMDLLNALKRSAPRSRLPDSQKSILYPAYPNGKTFHDPPGLSRFFEEFVSDAFAGSHLWFMNLIQTIQDEFYPEELEILKPFLTLPVLRLSDSYKAFLTFEEKPLSILDALDNRLSKEGRVLYILYDELDTTGGPAWMITEQAVRGLLQFWSIYSRRWKSIRSKIFLRSDLYSRFSISAGSDLSRLSANLVELTWSDENMYAMLIKRIVNTSPAWETFSRKVGLSFTSDPDIGLICSEKNIILAGERLISGIIGPYMGANANKGLTWRWVLEHVRDGKKRAYPRPFVRLFEKAAENQQASGKFPVKDIILDPLSIRRAMDRVSLDQISDLRDEIPWIDSLKKSISGKLVPMERKDLDQILKKWLKEHREVEDPKSIQTPYETPKEMIDLLMDLGIFRERPHDRFDVPDLFLAGLGLKRKGGVRKK